MLVSAEDSWKAHTISGMLVEAIVGDQRTSRPQHRVVRSTCTVCADEHAFNSALAATSMRDPGPFQHLASRRATGYRLGAFMLPESSSRVPPESAARANSQKH